MFAPPLLSPRRNFYTMREKTEVVKMVTARLETGESRSACAADLGISRRTLRQWEREHEKIAIAVKVKKKGNLKTLHSGRPGILGPHEDEILQWFVEMRNEGKIVTYRMVGHFVCGLSGVFKRKSVGAR